MINCVDLISNSERELKLEDLGTLKLTDIWLELREPTREELEAVSEKSEIPIDLLEIKDVSQSISLRWEQDLE